MRSKAEATFQLSALQTISHSRERGSAPSKHQGRQIMQKTHELASHEKRQQWQTTVLEQFYPRDPKCHLKDLTARTECH